MSLIPHPDNVLGKNILPAETETGLLADGMLFAAVLVAAGQKDRAGFVRRRPLVLCGRRCPVVAGREGIRDWMYAAQPQQPQPLVVVDGAGETAVAV